MTKTKPKQEKHSKEFKRPRPRWLDPAIVVALIGLMGIIISTLVASPFFSKLIERTYPSTSLLPTATPFLFVSIKSLDVIHEDNSIETINPGGEIKLTQGSNVTFKVNVITNTGIEALIFHWDFCLQQNSKIGQGAIQISYQMSEIEEDCITVKIERGGEFLDKADFFINRK